MAEVKAITPIEHGVGNGEVIRLAIGDTLTEGDFTEEQIRDFIAGGSAVEIGSGRKYTDPPNAAADPGAADDETRLRDQLIAQSLMADSPSPLDQPAASDALSSGSSAAGEGDKTIGQVAADANAEAAGNGGDGAATAAADREGQQ